MAMGNDSRNRNTRWIRWIARIWSIPILLYTLLFFIGYAWNMATTGVADPHAVEDVPAIEALPPLLLFLSVLGLAIAWRWEGLGGAITVVFHLAMLPVLLVHWPIAQDFARYLVAPYGTWMIVLIPGILFLVCWWRSRKRAIPQHGA